MWRRCEIDSGHPGPRPAGALGPFAEPTPDEPSELRGSLERQLWEESSDRFGLTAIADTAPMLLP